ncbi:hypothetical protein KCP76_20785 [Salmonella enterica subsp. enterica serovar Weltevreden]|nr:hypothetical protein KCP76_20785 [Salmonella enterica subsp. enterica serovar Weltevreden]
MPSKSLPASRMNCSGTQFRGLPTLLRTARQGGDANDAHGCGRRAYRLKPWRSGETTLTGRW